MSRLMCLAVVIILLTGSLNPVTAQKGIIPANETPIAGAIVKWSARFPHLHPERPTLLCIISVAHCLGCGCSAVNQAIGMLGEDTSSVNILVVVSTDARGEGVALKRKFSTPNVVEDNPENLKKLFGFSNGLPELVVVDRGAVVFHQADIQHNAVDVQEIRRALSARGISGVIKRTGFGVPLQEDDDNVVLSVNSPVLDSIGNIVTFYDGSQNDVFRFDLRSGARLGRSMISDKTGQYFRDATDTSGAWNSVIKYYSPLARIEGLTWAHNDSIEVLVKMLTGYSMVPMSPGGKLGALFDHGRCLLTLKIVDSTMELLSLRRLMQSPYMTLTDAYHRIGESFYIGCTFHEAALADTLWTRNHPDSTFTLMTVCGNSLKITPLLSLPEQERQFGASALEYMKHIAVSGDQLFYLDGGNGAFLTGQVSCDSFAYRPVGRGGVLNALYEDAGQANADSAVINFLEINGLLAASPTTVHAVLSGADTIPGRSYIVVQRYRNGSYSGEVVYHYGVDDELVEVVPAGYSGGEIVAFAKWKNRRWTVERFPAE